MSIILDQNYISQIAYKLERFSKQRDNLWIFRCPLCGDSKKKKSKRRGFFYQDSKHGTKDYISFMCHNCGESSSFGGFLKKFDPILYKEYLSERFKESGTFKKKFTHSKTSDIKPIVSKPISQDVKIKNTAETNQFLSKMECLDTLFDEHIARFYISSRKIPEQFISQLYFTESFKSICKEFNPGASENLYDDARIVIPFIDENGTLIGLQGRGFEGPRYITMKKDDNSKKIFGLNNLNRKRVVFVVEGAFDSMFLPNAVACNDSSLINIENDLNVKHDKIIYIWDNDKRNKQIVYQMMNAAKQNKKILVWNKCKWDGSDINDLFVKNDITRKEILHYIGKNVYSGLKAILQINKWKRC